MVEKNVMFILGIVVMASKIQEE